jgi:hypothetical protein
MNQLVTQVRQVLVATPDRWLALTVSVDPDLLSRQPSAGEWSAAECLRHLLDAELGIFQVRLEAFMTGRSELRAFDRATAGVAPDASREPRVMARRLAEARVASLESLGRVSDADLDRTARHHRLGPVTLREMLAQWAGHDLMHTVQAERALMQPFIEDCGPWRSSFADHDAGLK